MQKAGLIVISKAPSPFHESAVMDYVRACFREDLNGPEVNVQWGFTVVGGRFGSDRVGEWNILLMDVTFDPGMPPLKGEVHLIVAAPEDGLPDWEAQIALRFAALRRNLDNGGVMHLPSLSASTGLELQGYSYHVPAVAQGVPFLEWFAGDDDVALTDQLVDLGKVVVEEAPILH